MFVMDMQALFYALKIAGAGGKLAYAYADERVGAYAEEEGISKSEAWGRVREEALRRGDAKVMEAADWLLANPVKAHLALLTLGPLAPMIVVGAALSHRHRKPVS